MIEKAKIEARLELGCGCMVSGRQGKDTVWRPYTYRPCETHTVGMRTAAKPEGREPWLYEPVA